MFWRGGQNIQNLNKISLVEKSMNIATYLPSPHERAWRRPPYSGQTQDEAEAILPPISIIIMLHIRIVKCQRF
jgi:hypothetical protein